MTESTSNHPSLTLCITELDVGGAEKALVRTAIGLSDGGWSVRVISLRDAGPLAEPLKEAGIPVTALGCGSFADIRAFWRLRSELKRHPADVLLTFLYQANMYGRLAGRSAGIRRIVSGVRVADQRPWVIATDRLTKFCVDRYIAVSESVAATHAARCGLNPAMITAIPNGVDSPQQAVRTAREPDPAVVLFVGRLSPQKDPLGLLEAFCRLPESLRQNTELRYIGDGPLQEILQRRIRQHGLAGHVHLQGRTDDVDQFMQQSTLLVLSSKWEGLPNVVLEAMARQLPVVATDVDGCAELITDGETGWLVPAEDPKALAEAMIFCLKHPHERQRRALNAHARVLADFSWATSIARYDKLLRSLLAE